MASPDFSATPDFSSQVERCFSRGAAAYTQQARLQAAVAARLGQLSSRLARAVPAGPRADLGAGSGLLSRAIEAQIGGPALLRLDSCRALLAEGARLDPQPAPQRHWDLNAGLPAELQGAALLASSFALQWLEHPGQQLQHWCSALQPGGVLLLAVPCAGSFGLWREAAQGAAVPFTGLALPAAEPLVAATTSLKLQRCEQLRFSRPNHGARAFLQEIKAIGAQASRGRRLSPTELRRLIAHWPGPEQAIVWEVLVLMGVKR